MNYARLSGAWESRLGQEGIDCKEFYRNVDDLFATSSTSAARPPVVFPRRDLVFRAFHLVEPDEVCVILVGQDPYPGLHPHSPGEGVADGVAFSARGLPLPKSLERMLDNQLDEGLVTRLPTDSDLEPWARQGVLLLNTALSVEPSPVRSVRDKNRRRHQRVYEPVLRAVLRTVNQARSRLPVMLVGQEARRLKSEIRPTVRGQVVVVKHPSRSPWPGTLDPISPFGDINAFLAPEAIDWTLP